MKSTHVINKMDEHLGYLSHPDTEAKVTTPNMIKSETPNYH
jgi:hypothetical protein